MSLDNEDRSGNAQETPAVSLRPQLHVSVGSQDKASLWKLDGEVDLSSAPLLYEHYGAAAPDPGANLIIDLRAVTFLDSSGLAFLTFVHQDLRAQGSQLIVLEPPSAIRRLFDITGLTPIFRIEPRELPET